MNCVPQINSSHCCNDCQSVIEAYRFKKWNPNTENFTQCKDQQKFESEKEKHALDEGCRVAGYLEVNRYGGVIKTISSGNNIY